MKVIRWLLGHTFLILVIVAVIYSYMFWGNLVGEGAPAGKALAYLSNEFDEVGEFVAAIKAKQARLGQQESPVTASSEDYEPVAESEVPVVAESVDTGADVSTQIQLAEAEAAETVAEKNNYPVPVDENRNENRNEGRNVEQQQVSISSSLNNTQVKQNEAGTIEAGVERADDVVTANLQRQSTVANVQSASGVGTKNNFVSTEIEKQLNNVDRHGELKHDRLKRDKLKQDVQQGGAIRASWITARKSFYQRNYTLSEKKYQDVIDNTEDNYDAYGELGNVYFNQGKKRQAATAYFEAAAILLRKGQARRARSLIGLLQHLDKAKANELQKLIDSSLS